MSYEIVTTNQQIYKMGIIGAPGTGKTTGALTFPNPRVLASENKFPAGTRVVPFYTPEVRKMFADKEIGRSDARSALINFIRNESSKRGPNETEIIDSWTNFINAFEIWAERLAPVIYKTKSSDEIDYFKLHKDRLDMCYEIMHALMGTQCHFVVICHEYREMNRNGIPVGTFKPICRGQFANQFTSMLNTYVRQVVLPDGKYCWQVVPDALFQPIIPPWISIDKSKLIQGKYILAKYEELQSMAKK